MIFDKEKHEPLSQLEWDKEKVEKTIDDIFKRTTSSLTENLWPPHESEDSKASINKSFYMGAAGTLWGLSYLVEKKSYHLPFSAEGLIHKINLIYQEEPDSGSICPSYFLGEVGINLLKYKISQKEETLNRLYSLIESNIENPCVDALWGAPGTMLPALFLYSWTSEVRFKELFKRNADFLFDEWKFYKDSGAWYWEYKQGESIVPYIGAGHGFFGNIFPLLKGIDLLSIEQKEILLKRSLEMSKKFSVEKDSIVNWPATFFGKGTEYFMTQWCHGAPGVIQSLGPISKNYDQELEHSLLKSGELIWQAGPLKKGIGICHGTDGNGISLLKLFQRTGDAKWLERAQRFAMHSIESRNYRHTLWTGELGLACFLQGCLDEEGFFPGLDFF